MTNLQVISEIKPFNGYSIAGVFLPMIIARGLVETFGVNHVLHSDYFRVVFAVRVSNTSSFNSVKCFYFYSFDIDHSQVFHPFIIIGLIPIALSNLSFLLWSTLQQWCDARSSCPMKSYVRLLNRLIKRSLSSDSPWPFRKKQHWACFDARCQAFINGETTCAKWWPSAEPD